MPILPSGDIFAGGAAVSGSKNRGAKTFKYCPYSTQITDYSQDSRVPGGEKIHHGETGGRLHVYSLGGGVGWMCADNDCAYFVGSAVTEVIQQGRRKVYLPSGTCPTTENDFTTLSGTVEAVDRGRVIVSGTRYYEI